MFQPIITNWESDESLFSKTIDFLREKNVPLHGVLHIGAYMCEEKDEYNSVGISDKQIVWIEGNKDLYELNKKKGIQYIFNALISDSEKDVTFHITNNGSSSSIYALDAHSKLYPHIHVTEKRTERTTTLVKLFDTYNLSPKNYNIWNIDIQGAEYDAIVGGEAFLDYVDAIYCEVNFVTMYKDIPLLDKLYSFLTNKGFVLTHLKNWQNCWGDALFVKDKYIH